MYQKTVILERWQIFSFMVSILFSFCFTAVRSKVLAFGFSKILTKLAKRWKKKTSGEYNFKCSKNTLGWTLGKKADMVSALCNSAQRNDVQSTVNLLYQRTLPKPWWIWPQTWKFPAPNDTQSPSVIVHVCGDGTNMSALGHHSIHNNETCT